MDKNVAKGIKRRERIQAKPDHGLLNALKSGDQNALMKAMSMKTEAALAAVEETIALYSGDPNVTFYQLGGTFESTASLRESALQELTMLANNGKLLDDPAYSQYCISRLGRDTGNVFMQNLYRENSQACYDYQLLGIQMQLSILINA